jgi:hypothetical protein
MMKKTEEQKLARKLEQAVKENKELKRLLDVQERLTKRLLLCWLERKSHKRVKFILGFYRTEQRLEMLNALLTYVTTGKATRFEREVQNWHFRLLREHIDEDRYTDAVHKMLLQLWKKIGVFQKVDSQN